MRERFSGSMLAAIAAAGAVILGPINPTAAQTSTPPATASSRGVDDTMGRTGFAGYLDRRN